MVAHSHRFSIMSIYELARRYSREEILVEPLKWTGRHLQLLEFSFTEPCAANPKPHSSYSNQSSGMEYIASYLCDRKKYTPESKVFGSFLRHLAALYKPRSFSPPMGFI